MTRFSRVKAKGYKSWRFNMGNCWCRMSDHVTEWVRYKKHAVKKHAVMHGIGIPNADHGYLIILSCTRRLIVLTVNRAWICRHKSMNWVIGLTKQSCMKRLSVITNKISTTGTSHCLSWRLKMLLCRCQSRYKQIARYWTWIMLCSRCSQSANVTVQINYQWRRHHVGHRKNVWSLK